MTKQDPQEAEKLTELLQIAEGHPMVKAMKAEEAAKILGARQAAAAVIARAEKAAAVVVPGLEVELSKAQEDLAEHDRERKSFLDKVTTARIALAEERRRCDYDVSQAEGVLMGNYDARIDEAIRFFMERFDALRVKSPAKQTHKAGTNVFTETKTLLTYSNAPAIREALAYCTAAIRDLEAMKLTPAVPLERIEALRKGIPDADDMTELTAEKPLPRVNTDPLSMLRSDGERAWTARRLNERFKKLTKRN
jgi:hypothetical protein